MIELVLGPKFKKVSCKEARRVNDRDFRTFLGLYKILPPDRRWVMVDSGYKAWGSGKTKNECLKDFFGLLNRCGVNPNKIEILQTPRRGWLPPPRLFEWRKSKGLALGCKRVQATKAGGIER